MNYIENVFFCLAAPLLIAIFCADGFHRRRPLIFVLFGMVSCLLSSYISSFLVMYYDANLRVATIEIAPVVEEIIKVLPMLFFLMIFEPHRKDVAAEAVMIAVGFATLENTCYLLTNGADNIFRILIRGFSSGAMHVACGAITALGFSGLWTRLPSRIAGGLGSLCMAFTWHAIFNMLVAQTGIALIIGYVLPILIVISTVLIRRRLFPSPNPPGMP